MTGRSRRLRSPCACPNVMSERWAPLVSLGRNLWNGFAQLIYPNTCWVCGSLMPSEQRSVCERCQCHLLHDPFQSCPRCSSTVGPHLILEEGCPQCRDQPYAFDGAFRM